MPVDRLDIRAFGPLQIRRGTGTLAVAGRTSRAVLCALMLDPGEPVGIERITQLVWSRAAAPANPDHAVQTHITRLRRLLGVDLILTDHHGYHLAVPREHIDIQRFERCACRGDECLRQRDYRTAAMSYEAALVESRHLEPLLDLDRSNAGRAERARLIELQFEAEERHAASALLAHEPVMSELEGLAVAQPLRELRWAMLIWAQAAAGRQAAALRSCGRARDALREVGLSPGPGLRSLEHRILQQDPSLGEPLLVEDLVRVVM